MAKSLTQAEVDKVLSYIATKSFAQRNRVILLTSFWSGMRVGEIASLKIGDVMNNDGTIKHEVRLTAEQTKGRHPRVVFIGDKLRIELQRYMDMRRVTDLSQPLFVTAGNRGFSANVLTQTLWWIYRKAGIDGGSSHSGRKSFLTNLADKGVSIHVLASLAGHRNVTVTMKYLTANENVKRNAVNLV